MKDIDRFYVCSKMKFSSKQEAKQKMRQFCIANVKLLGFDWYRAEIVDWLDKDESKVRVQFIDYGDTMDVPFQDLRPLHWKFGEQPKYCIKCKMANVSVC